MKLKNLTHTSISQVNLPLAPRTHSWSHGKPLPVSSPNILSWPSSYFELYPVYILDTVLWTGPLGFPMNPHWSLASYMPIKWLWLSHQNVDQMMSPSSHDILKAFHSPWESFLLY